MSDKKIPTSKAKRVGVAGKTAAEMGAKRARFLMKSAFLSKDKRQEARQTHDQELAETLFKGLSRLRGTALKLAQALCSETGVLPPSYLQQLERACYQVPPLNRAVVYQVIESELGGRPEEIFKNFDTQAFAAASLGQVHKAESKDGEPLAVKIQYPGIQKTIENDLQMIESFFVPLRKNLLLKRTFDEVKTRLIEETDYRSELANTYWFAQQDVSFNIPKTYPQYSSEKVLTTGFVSGQHLQDWLKTGPSQPLIDRVGQKLVDFFWHSLNQLNKIHSDPNMGNYLFSKDGNISLIDFGSIKEITPLEAKAFSSLWQEKFEPHLTADLYAQLGARFDSSEVSSFVEQVIQPYRNWIDSLPKRFSSSESVVMRGQEILNQSAEDPRLENFSIGFTLVHRTLFGLIQALQKMNAKVSVPGPVSGHAASR